MAILLPECKKNLDLHTLKTDLHGHAFMYMFDKAVQHYINRDWTKCLRDSKSVLDITWEHLNTGYWKDVDISWRYAYSYASLFKSVSEYHISNVTGSDLTVIDAIKTCDMGLLLGAPILDNILTKYVNYLQNVHIGKHQIKHIASAEAEEPLLKKCRKENISYPNIDVKCGVQTSNLPSLESFKTNYMDSCHPVLICGAIDYWPALSTKKWTLEYIKQMAGFRTVPIEIGSKYTEETWSQKLMLISEFIERFIEKPKYGQDVGYLAQHELFDQIPELQDDISIPTYCSLGKSEDVNINAWFGPGGTISPLHHDPKHNFLCQVVGEKFIKLYSSADSCYLYPHESPLLFNTSQIDVENPDVVKFPKFPQAKCLECLLKPGQMLYIPPKYWHFVRSLSTSFSVSFWWE